MKRILTFLFILSAFTLHSYGVISEVDTVYYDKNWTVVSNHHFADYYMIVEKNDVEGSPKRYRGFYITGELQSEGVLTHIDENNASKSIMGDGEHTYYYKNGQVAAVQHFKNGMRNGEFVNYLENGNISKKGNLNNDKLDGLYIEINNEGLCFKQEYKDGNPIHDYYIVTNQDGLFSRIRNSDNSHVYNTPPINQKKRDNVDGVIWNYYDNDGVTVAINVTRTDDFGKYYRVYLVVENNSFFPMVFRGCLKTKVNKKEHRIKKSISYPLRIV